MVLPFFGKKTAGPGKNGAPTTEGHLDATTSMGFTHVGDVGRALADAAGKIQVQEASIEEVAVIEEAAVLFANANDGGACAVLEEAVAGVARRSELVWRMLFDLFRLTGDKAGFDRQGVHFAEVFEKSPPVWQGEEAPAKPVARESSPAVNLSGTLSGNARPQFEQLVRIGAKVGRLRVDLARLRGFDEAGCILLTDTLESLRRQRVQVGLLGAQHAFGLLEPQLRVGEREGRAFWLAALAMLQQLGDQERFEDTAINFAVTFEESPPSWEAPTVPPLTASGEVPVLEEAPAPPAREGFVLEGVIAGSQPEVLRKLAVYGSERNRVVIDARDLRRLEFVSAGSLFNQLALLQGQGKLCVIEQPNAMVAALLRVMGIDQVAQIEERKG